MKQVKALMLCLSRETLAVVHNLRLSKEQIKKLSAIIKAMQRYVDGHINEKMEHHKFHHRTQQQGETFEVYLIPSRELAKTCKFCSKACMQKSIRDQIIGGLHDECTVEDLLQESDLTLTTTVAKCRSKKVAKKNRSQMVVQEQETDKVATLHNPQPGAQQKKSHTCPGCGGTLHKGYLVDLYVTRFAKTRHNDAFLEIQIFASMNSIYLKLCSVVISMLYCKYFSRYKAR